MLISIMKERLESWINELELKKTVLKDICENDKINFIEFKMCIESCCIDVDRLIHNLQHYLISNEQNDYLKIDEYMCIIKTEDVCIIQDLFMKMDNIFKDLKVEI